MSSKQKQPKNNSMLSAVKLDCSACKKEKQMFPTMISVMSPVVVTIGGILTLPSMFGILISVIMFLVSVITFFAMRTVPYAALGVGLSIGMSVLIGVLSLVGGLLGNLLIMKKKVYKCSVCGFIINRD